MVTVKDAVKLLRGAKEISLVWNGLATDLDLNSTFEMDAYGDYVVSRIGRSASSDSFEIHIAMTPVKVSAAEEL